MFTAVVAAVNRQVVVVDSDPLNLAHIRRSLELEGISHNVRIFYNSVRSGLSLSLQSSSHLLQSRGDEAVSGGF